MKKFMSVLLAAIMLLSCVSLAGCGEKEEDGITKITWYLPTVLEGRDVSMVMDKVNEVLSERYQLKLDLICTDWGSYNQKMQVINAGREPYDLFYVRNFADSIKNGVLYDITDILPTVAPKTWEALDETNWEAVTVDGRIYGVPNWQVQAYQTGISSDKSKFDKANVDITTIKDMDDITEYLRTLQKVDPEANVVDPWWYTMTATYGMQEVIQEKMVGAIRFKEEGKPVVFNQFKSEEFKEYITQRRSWVEEGLVPDYYENNHNASTKGIQKLAIGVTWIKPGVAEESSFGAGYEMIAQPLSEPLMTTKAIQATMTGVSTTSKHPEQALKMIEIMYSDPEVYNLLCWGIEGVHYNKNEDGQIVVVEDSGYDRIANWKIGPIYNSLQTAGTRKTVYEETKEFNENAVVSPLLGFIFDTAPVASELSNVQTVIDKQLQTLEMGLVETDEGLEAFLKALDVAGADDIIAELQKQIDEWWVTK